MGTSGTFAVQCRIFHELIVQHHVIYWVPKLQVLTYSLATEMIFVQKLKRIDYGGNIIIIGSTVSILYALTYGGTRYAWSDGHVGTFSAALSEIVRHIVAFM